LTRSWLPSGDDDSDRRFDDRFRRPAHAFYASASQEGRGLLYDLSMKGARVERAEPRLHVGMRLFMTFSVRGDLFPVDIGATVTRQTETGFAVAFDALDFAVLSHLEPLIRTLAAKDEEEDDDDTEPTLP
jgi:hypothetical protein